MYTGTRHGDVLLANILAFQAVPPVKTFAPRESASETAVTISGYCAAAFSRTRATDQQISLKKLDDDFEEILVTHEAVCEEPKEKQ